LAPGGEGTISMLEKGPKKDPCSTQGEGFTKGPLFVEGKKRDVAVFQPERSTEGGACKGLEVREEEKKGSPTASAGPVGKGEKMNRGRKASP